MLRKIILLINLLNVSISYSQYCILSDETFSPTEEFQCNDNAWILVFEDDFNGNLLDESKWTAKTGFIRNFNHEKEWYTPENIEISNGILKLITRKENPPISGTYWNGASTVSSTFDYSSAEIDSKNDYKFQYGKFEIKCKIPKGKGFWPAFWLNGGPRYNEIDIFEFLSGDIYGDLDITNLSKRHFMTVHYDFDGDGQLEMDQNGLPYESCKETYIGPDFSEKYYIFGAEWDKYKIEWYIIDDGIRYSKRIITKYHYLPLYGGQDYVQADCEDINIGSFYKKELVFPIDPMRIIANLAIESNNNSPDATTPFPSALEIDYIKVWQRESQCCTPYRLYESTNNLPAYTQTKEYIKAGNDAGISGVSGNVTVKDGQNVTFKAPYIELLPGFETELGANFKAEAVPCTQLIESENDDITINNIPIIFSPDGDGNGDELVVNVSGATSYDIWVRDQYNINTFYSATNIPVYSNYFSVWDGDCNMNCGIYNKCNRLRQVHLTFHNCDNSVAESRFVLVSCSSKSADSISNNVSNNILADNTKKEKAAKIIENKTVIYDKFESSPNPFSISTDITFGIQTTELVHLYLLNSLGINVLELSNGVFNEGNHKISINGNQISSGVYYCVFETKNERKIIRVVKI